MVPVLRRYGTTPYGVFGELKVAGQVFYTVEKPWRMNEPRVSCVPCGPYKLLWRTTTTPVPASFNNSTWYLQGKSVGLHGENKKRTNCAIHIGNTDDDVTGCIAVGTGLGYVDRRWAVMNSRGALEELLDIIGSEDTEVLIESHAFGWIT